MVSPVDLFIDHKRTLKAFLCRGKVTKSLQDAAEVVDADGYAWMVFPVDLFADCKRTLTIASARS
jgi:hypothetical protein